MAAGAVLVPFPLTAGAGAVFVLFLLVGLAVPLVLYLLVRAEHDQRQEMDRAAAERTARRDTRDGRERE